MCRLLGLAANKPVDFEFSLERFKEFATDNPNGWGIGWYESNMARVFRQGIGASDRESRLSVLSKEVRSKIIIAHVRRKGKGAAASKINSHPFQYRNWIFAHNGSVDREYLLSLLGEELAKEIEGETDSEVYFYWILQNIEACGNVIEGVKEAISKIRRKDHSGLNFLLSDGKTLYAFRYSGCRKDYYSLYKLERAPSSPGPLEFQSPETEALLRSKSLKGEKAVLVCSEKLTSDENWVEIGSGNLLEINGDLVTKEMQIL